MNGAAFLQRAAELLEQGDREGARGLIAEALADLGDLPSLGVPGEWRGLEGLPAEVRDAARELAGAVLPVAVRTAFPDGELRPEQLPRLREQLPPLMRRAASLGHAPDWRAEAQEVVALALGAGDGVPALWRVRKHAERLRELADAEEGT